MRPELLCALAWGPVLCTSTWGSEGVVRLNLLHQLPIIPFCSRVKEEKGPGSLMTLLAALLCLQAVDCSCPFTARPKTKPHTGPRTSALAARSSLGWEGRGACSKHPSLLRSQSGMKDRIGKGIALNTQETSCKVTGDQECSYPSLLPPGQAGSPKNRTKEWEGCGLCAHEASQATPWCLYGRCLSPAHESLCLGQPPGPCVVPRSSLRKLGMLYSTFGLK